MKNYLCSNVQQKCNSVLSENKEIPETDLTTVFFIFSGDYVLYWSFDTLDNVILMEGTEQNNFGSLVFRQVT